MATRFFVPLILFVSLAQAQAQAQAQPEIPNPLIDYDAFQLGVDLVAARREAFRVTESEFVRMSRDPKTVILDARSREKFEMLHVKGAKNLSLPDITEEELAKVIPSKTTRVLIYCNNNFSNEPKAFPAKDLSASLNVYTLNVLFAYGYKNVYELGPLIDIREDHHPVSARRAGGLSTFRNSHLRRNLWNRQAVHRLLALRGRQRREHFHDETQRGDPVDCQRRSARRCGRLLCHRGAGRSLGLIPQTNRECAPRRNCLAEQESRCG